MSLDRNLSGCQVFKPANAPSEWDCIPLRERIALQYGRALKEDVRRQGSVSVFGSNGQVGSHDEHWLDGPGVIVGRKGTVGAVHYTEQPFWPIDTAYYLQLLDRDSLRYIYYLLDYLPLKSLNAATGVPGLSRRDAYALFGNFPPKAEQTRIVRVLDVLDVAIGKSRDALTAAESLRRSLAEKALTVGIDERNRFREETIESAKAFRATKIGRFPIAWRATILGKECTRITDGTHQAVATSREGVPFLYVSCVRDGIIYWDRAARVSERDYKLISKGRAPKKGAVLYTAVGSYGFAATVTDDRQFSFQRHIAILYPKPNELDSLFLATWLNCSIGRRWSDILAVGNAQKTVTLTALYKFPIVVPSFDEQLRIRALLEPIDAVVTAREQKHKSLEVLKQALMHDLLTGAVRVDPKLLNEEEQA